MGGHINVILGG